LTHDSATSRPPPVECRAHTTPHSAHRPRPWDTFSTLQPVITRRSSTSAAAPTRNLEYGAYAPAAAWVALSRNTFQSIKNILCYPATNFTMRSRSLADPFHA